MNLPVRFFQWLLENCEELPILTCLAEAISINQA